MVPSVTQRKLIGGIAAMLKWIGVPLQAIFFFFLLRFASRQISVDEKAHPIRLNGSEEDDHILMHAW